MLADGPKHMVFLTAPFSVEELRECLTRRSRLGLEGVGAGGAADWLAGKKGCMDA